MGISCHSAFSASPSPNVFQFRMPGAETYRLEPTALRAVTGSNRVDWVKAYRGDSTNFAELGSRVVVQVN
jgi:hypothetical protein